jgi:hypothetical protein
MPATTETLPEGYTLHETINLQKDRKAAVPVNGAAIVIMLVLLYIGYRIMPGLSEIQTGWPQYLVLFAGLVLYILLHEAVHGIYMRAFSGVRPHYGFTGLYAYAGSDVYFSKRHYLRIALAPLVIWGILLAVLNALVPAGWFWVVYLIQIINISGAAGDLYVCVRFSKLPADILIQDTGVEMRVFLPK